MENFHYFVENMVSIRTSPVVHWKVGRTPVLDEAIHPSGVKVGVGTPTCGRILGFQETGEKKRDCC
jgi:hypothetical protein